ncbi:Hypothetical protein ADU72_0553 [Pediococcus damnosus]|uniref:Uncharacterized protein n=1 Tax=Pediococcus damnosus TaxID=51663 RepID=A0AAC9FJN1_9LACO|nr:hypothetical protein [Pediococcus damnosus]AMV60993.1 Hypothetical protein ADU69_1340 [Pediococcus damnosus]AMV63562.1 Hypothetical protein ADU70_2096 [Pediococcus damnosus]AMV65353.1 Hypothetical protein ADU71_1461 [Pediococcus damnosus]AMV66498.1 Hypothetical protein ADU72_0553 [Pediococcus damnosus]AMV68801.1 Hypothetical protein ADU73_0391 [Pediococcus damnosus]
MADTEKKTLSTEEKNEIDTVETLQQSKIKEQIAEFPITKA